MLCDFNHQKWGNRCCIPSNLWKDQNCDRLNDMHLWIIISIEKWNRDSAAMVASSHLTRLERSSDWKCIRKSNDRASGYCFSTTMSVPKTFYTTNCSPLFAKRYLVSERLHTELEVSSFRRVLQKSRHLLVGMPKRDTNDGHVYEFYRLGYGRKEGRTASCFHATQIDQFVTDRF